MQICVLLSIKPEFVEKIFEGSKRYEFRRCIFKNKEINKVFVYASFPVQKVIGEFEIDDILTLDVNKLWQKTKKYSGIEEEPFYNYFLGKNIGHAIKISKTRRYKMPLDLQERFDLERPPQSFAYVSEEWRS